MRLTKIGFFVILLVSTNLAAQDSTQISTDPLDSGIPGTFSPGSLHPSLS